MSFLKSDVPSPGQALDALRRRSTSRKSSGAEPTPLEPTKLARSRRVGGKATVGLDIQPGYIAAVETAPGSVAVRRAAFAELSPDLVREGEVVDPEALGGVLNEFFTANGLPNRVRIGLANQRIVMRTVDLPPITDDKQLASAVRFQAQEHIAMPLDQAVLEHQSLGLMGTADGPRSRVVLVAARRDMVERLLTAAHIGGLRVEGIDLSAFALIRALHRPTDGDTQLAFVNLGSSTNLAVASAAQCVFTRVVPVGFDALVTDLSSRRGLITEHSRGWLRHVGMSLPVDEIEGEAEMVRATREVLEDGVARIAAEIRATLDFYSGQTGGALTERAVITGPGASIPGLAEGLALDLGIPVEVRVVSEGQTGAFAGIDPAALTIAAGLTTIEAPA